MLDDVTLVILAGGKSQRLGRNKAFVLLRGRTLLDHMRANLESAFADVIVSAADSSFAAPADLPVVFDAFRDAGPLAGMHAALSRSTTMWNFCVACDMPFLRSDVAATLRRHADGADDLQVVLPKLSAGPEPLAGLYRTDCAPAFEETILAGQRRIVSAFTHLRVSYVPGEFFPNDPFFNINTQHDLERANARLLKGTSALFAG